jgi:glycosyltransferase involved in cell wall biosynthesis
MAESKFIQKISFVSPLHTSLVVSVKVFHSYPFMTLSGVMTWSRHLLVDPRQLLLLTTPDEVSLTEAKSSALAYADLPPQVSRRAQWQRLADFLRGEAPCIYLPNFDFHRSCAVGLLPSTVAVCSVLHSDDECYYDELRRLRHRFDAVVAVSEHIATVARQRFPDIANRLQVIPYGVPAPATLSPKPSGEPIRLAYCNRLAQTQKQVFELPKVATALEARGCAFVLTIAGDGPDRDALEGAFRSAGFLEDRVQFVGRLNPPEVQELLEDSHLFILTSAYEGLPLSLLEAMAAGCVPISYAVTSGIPEAVTDGENGRIVPMNDPDAMAEAISQLTADPVTRGVMAQAAHSTARKRYSVERMVANYRSLFTMLGEAASAGRCLSGDGKVHPPPDLTFSYRLRRAIRRFQGKPPPKIYAE